MKPVLAALVGASLAAAPVVAAAQHHGGGGHWSGGGAWSGGAHNGGAWSGGWRGGGSWPGGWHGGGHFHHFNDGFPVFFGGFGLGLALGSAWDPWWDYAYYGYPAYTVIEHDYGYPPPDGGYYYDRYNRDYGAAPPPPPAAAAPSGPCDKWQWDAARSQYYWIACPTAAPPPAPR